MSDKKKKKKTVYIDDGRTIADMSDLYGNKSSLSGSSYGHPRASFKEQMKTYFTTVKMMFLPMLVTMGIICVVFLLLYLIFELAA